MITREATASDAAALAALSTQLGYPTQPGEAAERGYRKLRVRSNVVREDAHRFYEREGFRRTKTQMVLDRKLP
jgi:hypothetical protein